MVKEIDPLSTPEGRGRTSPRAIPAASLVLLICMLSSLSIHGCGGGTSGDKFAGLVSAANGSFLVDVDPDLKIESVVFHDYSSNEISIDINDGQGDKIKAIALRTVDSVKEFDIPRTLAANGVDTSILPEVPQEIIAHVADKNGSGEVVLYLLTDSAYPTSSISETVGTDATTLKFRGQVGQKGIQGFIAVEEDGIHLTAGDAGQVSIGEGPLAIIVAVRKKGNKLQGRSEPVVVKRKGIVHPDDAWFDAYKSGYFSRPFLAREFGTSRIAFVTQVKDQGPKIVISTFDFKYHYDVSNLFPEGPIIIDHWGGTDDDFDVLYVYGEFGERDIHRVKVSHATVMRVTGSHDQIIEEYIPEMAEKDEQSGEGDEETKESGEEEK